eukprot:TRINITY_DN1844_c0_g1_i2.p1 TRINITY_DN1844_c0_g1~~TRINITY_DN1844_c0_g1_i2.p1  ORF type:complete len:1097 (-),score=164.76 TRINITY_DN1844_c0_g1_i2:50-3340(-)
MHAFLVLLAVVFVSGTVVSDQVLFACSHCGASKNCAVDYLNSLADPCTYIGLVCDAAGTVTVVTQRCSMAVLPSTINTSLPQLTRLALADTVRVTEERLESLFSISTLRTVLMKKVSWEIGSKIPDGPGLRNLQSLTMGFDSLFFFPTLSTATQLRYLELSCLSCQYGGMEDWSYAQLEKLNTLILNGWPHVNKIPTWLPALTQLKTLNLNGNRIVGGLDFSLMPYNLTSLSLDNNQIDSYTPPASVSALTYLSFTANKITGTINGLLFPDMESLSIGLNKIGGSLPEDTFMRKIVELNAFNNRISGTLPTIPVTSVIKQISIQGNLVHGSLPSDAQKKWILPPSLEILKFGYNSFTGTIPEVYGNLTKFDVPHNSLSGGLPLFMGVRDTLLSFNVAYNTDLMGPIPTTDRWVLETSSLKRQEETGEIPTSIYFESILETLDITETKVGGGSFFRHISMGIANCALGSVPLNCNGVPYFYCDMPACYDTYTPCDDLNMCGPGATCTPNGNWYTCDCDPVNYIQKDYYTCTPINTCGLFGCGEHATCYDGTYGSGLRVCTCDTGFTSPQSGVPLYGDSTFIPCDDTPNPCNYPGCNGKPHTTCTLVEDLNSRKCSCDAGYAVAGTNLILDLTLNVTRPFPGCDVVNMCTLYDCDVTSETPLAMCKFDPKIAFRRDCICPFGFNGTQLGMENDTLFDGCTPINLCETDNGGCSDVCNFVAPGVRTCSCSDPNAELESNDKTCKCHDGYKKVGNKCIEVNECELYGCSGGVGMVAANCTDLLFSRRCDCPSGFVGSNLLLREQAFLGCTDFPECVYRCDENSKCSEPEPRYRLCTCDRGYQGTERLLDDAPFGGCVDINECADPNACSEGNDCTNTEGGFSCDCKPGFSKKDIDDEICYEQLGGSMGAGGIVGIVVGLLALLIILLAVVWFLRNSKQIDLSSLPPDVRWFYEKYQQNPGSWEEMSSSDAMFYQKQLDPGSEGWDRMRAIIDDFAQGKSFVISDAYMVYNPALISSFMNSRSIMMQRLSDDPALFSSKNFLLSADSTFRNWVYNKYMDRVNSCQWNSNQPLPVLPLVHGTSLSVARKICTTGFASLSSLV